MELEEAKERLKSLKENVFVLDCHAIETVLQELDRLQKENEELKNKIKDCLDDVENYFENASVPYEDIEFIKKKKRPTKRGVIIC